MSSNWGDADFPPAPIVSAQTAGFVARPLVVARAATVWFVAAGCWLLAGLASELSSKGAVTVFVTNTSTIGQTDQGTVSVTHTATETVAPAIVLTIGAVLVALWVGLIFLVRNGTNWARITLLILAIIGELTTLSQILNTFGGTPPDTWAIVAGLLDFGVFWLVIAGLIMMFQPNARPYFRHR
jgi:hypothetical protein